MYSRLNINTVEDESYPPNVFETLANAGQISRSIGIFYKPEDEDDQPELVWGACTSSKPLQLLTVIKVATMPIR